MSSNDFITRYEDTLIAIEDAVEAALEVSDIDLDYESVNGILTLTCADGSSIIITPQSATQQLWLAARSGGFHFDYKDGQWICDADGETLVAKLAAICREQAGVEVDFQIRDDI